MKKVLLGATVCLSMLATVSKAQNNAGCGMHQAMDYFKKNLPGYKERLEAQEASERHSMSAARTATWSTTDTITIPVVFHVLHQNGPENIADIDLVNALGYVNNDYSRMHSDTSTIDPYFKPLYKNSYIRFALAQKDPQGNCTNGIVHHYDENTNWAQANILGYKYSALGADLWNPSKYLNIYIVTQIIDDGGSTGGTIIGYTYKPGTAPVPAADAIVYRYDNLYNQYVTRSLSHEIGHWLGLSHTFGNTNNPGTECGDDNVYDTPKTTGYFSTCPKVNFISTAPTLTSPTGNTDITSVKIGSITVATGINSLSGTRSITSGTTVTSYSTAAKGTAGEYSNFLDANVVNVGQTTFSVVVSVSQNTAAPNGIAVFVDKNNNGIYETTETVLKQTATVLGAQTFSGNISVATAGFYKLRVAVRENDTITSGSTVIGEGEYEDYLVNTGLGCDSIRPNMENIMDYASCPKMFTVAQIDVMRTAARSATADRAIITSTNNLVNTTGACLEVAVGTYTTVTPPSTVVVTHTVYNYPLKPAASCAPIADFASNKLTACSNQSVTFNSTSYNGSISNYSWTFEGGNPSTSNSFSQLVTYSTPGIYSVSLVVTNANGSNQLVRNSYVTVRWNTDSTYLPYTEGFEAGLPVNRWYSQNYDANSPAFKLASYGSNNTSKSVVLENYGYYTPGQEDAYESAQYNFSNVTNVSFSFDYSYARRTATTDEDFKVQYSTDCGGTWNLLPGSPTEVTLAASGGTVETGSYYPFTAAKWVTKTIPSTILTALNNKRDVKFRFYFRNASSGRANNLYIDNINITGIVGLQDLARTIDLSIYPNPTNGASTLEFTSPVSSKVEVTVNDVTGRLVEKSNFTTDAGVTSKYEVNKSQSLHSGIYFITLSLDGQKVTKKLIIE